MYFNSVRTVCLVMLCMMGLLGLSQDSWAQDANPYLTDTTQFRTRIDSSNFVITNVAETNSWQKFDGINNMDGHLEVGDIPFDAPEFIPLWEWVDGKTNSATQEPGGYVEIVVLQNTNSIGDLWPYFSKNIALYLKYFDQRYNLYNPTDSFLNFSHGLSSNLGDHEVVVIQESFKFTDSLDYKSIAADLRTLQVKMCHLRSLLDPQAITTEHDLGHFENFASSWGVLYDGGWFNRKLPVAGIDLVLSNLDIINSGEVSDVLDSLVGKHEEIICVIWIKATARQIATSDPYLPVWIEQQARHIIDDVAGPITVVPYLNTDTADGESVQAKINVFVPDCRSDRSHAGFQFAYNSAVTSMERIISRQEEVLAMHYEKIVQIIESGELSPAVIKQLKDHVPELMNYDSEFSTSFTWSVLSDDLDPADVFPADKQNLMRLGEYVEAKPWEWSASIHSRFPFSDQIHSGENNALELAQEGFDFLGRLMDTTLLGHQLWPNTYDSGGMLDDAHHVVDVCFLRATPGWFWTRLRNPALEPLEDRLGRAIMTAQGINLARGLASQSQDVWFSSVER